MEEVVQDEETGAPEAASLPPHEPVERVYRRLIAAVTLTGAAWRIVMLVSKWNTPLLLNDSFYYSLQASQNGRGHWYRAPSIPFTDMPSAEHPPLTSLVLTPASLLSNPVAWQRATMTLLGILLIPLIAMVGRKIGGRRVGVIAAIIAATYPNIWMSDSLVMSETLSLVLVTVALLAAIRFQNRFDVVSAALCGLAVGVAGNARSEVLLFAPLFALIGIRTRPFGQWLQRAVVVVVVAGLAVLPWVVYNLSRFESAVYMSTNDGTTLLGANCPLTYGGPGLGGWSILCLDTVTDPLADDPAAQSARRREAAVNFAREHEGRLPVVASARLLRAADLYGLTDLVKLDTGEERPEWAVWAGIASWWLLAPFAAAGWWRVRRRYGYLLAVPVINVLVVTIVFYGAHRLRSPMEPVVVVCAASAIVAIPAVRRPIDRWLTRTLSASSPERELSPAATASPA
jgi:4-amino-4-deoxy-L-arabinose transferase-like glycosyltransferase